MQLELRTRKLERCYLEQAQAIRAWGAFIAQRFTERMERLAFSTWEDTGRMRSLRLHRLKGEHQSLWAIDLDNRWRAILSYDRLSQIVTVEDVTNHYGD